VKYGSKADYHNTNTHRIWRDPLGLFTTLFLGISPEGDFFVAADPAMHDPTKFFIRARFTTCYTNVARACKLSSHIKCLISRS
jgi:hypothetical protein